MSEKSAKLVDFNGSPEDNKALSEIAKMAQKMLKEEYNILVTMPEAINTIAYAAMLSTAMYLDKHKQVNETTAINFLNFMTIGTTYRESEDGEKEGNFTPFLQAGTIFKTLIKSDDTTEDENDE